MDCGGCGTENRDEARFCISCGAPLVLRCVDCGADLPSGAKFCDSCGKAVGEPSAPRQPETVAVRKTVTVLFSDLTGSTSLGERLDPESVRAMMGPVYAAMRSEVETRGGTVAKFVGDGVMAIFGIPEVREDDAMRALDAAVGMRVAIDRLSADMPVPLSLKVGMNTGEVVIGAGDEDVVGDCVNVASRLEGAAAPGEVLVGEDTWRLTRANATYEAVAPLALKGKSQPVPAYRFVSLERTQEAGSTTFVGRDDELRRLIRVFDECVEANASRLVSIVGSPGLGKTRLARELGVALADRALVVETRCDAVGMATFAPVADALRTAAGIDEAAEPEAVVEAIKNLVPDDEDKDRIARRASALLGAGEPGSTEETFWAIRRLVEAAGRVQPMVLVLDDMHWAEPLLLDLVEHLAQWIRTAPVLLVVTGRPELREIRPSLTERDVVISLEGLDGRATELLAQGLLGSDRVPRELLARLPASTEGNPLFVREFVRMLVDDGILLRSGDEWIATINVDAIEVPPTIQSLLAARVDRLTSHERTVLELASVIGKEFYRGAIDELAPAGVKVGLDAHLESLRRKELVEPAGTYWIDEPVFRFHHALIQDAAYRRLLKESRAELHERVAVWLEAKTQGLLGEHDELIGYHLEQAHESRRQLGALDDHAVALGERAASLLASAARRALDLDDLPAAAALAGRALERLEDGHADRAEILLVRCESLLAMGDVTAATPAVWELAEISGSPRLNAWADCFSGELANLTDPTRLRETEKRVSIAAAELADLGDAAGAAKAHTVRATALAGLGRVAECESALDDALTAAREAGDRRRVTDVLGRAPTAALWGPSPVSRAGGRCLDIVRLLRITTGSPAVEATSLRCQAVLEAFRGRADAARRMLRKARRDLEELGLEHGIHETEMFAGIVELAAEDPAAAEPHLRSAHEGLLAMGIDVHAARAAALLASAHLAMGEEDEAERFADESERLGGDDLKTAIAWRAVRAQILARRGQIAEARELAESAVDIASRTDALIDHGDACAALAAVCAAAGDAAGTRRAQEQASALYERKGATALLERRGEIREESVSRVKSRDSDALENACTRVAEQCVGRLQAHDWDAVAALLAEDTVWNDYRAGLGTGIAGRAAALENFKAIVAIGVTRIENTCLALRGDRLSLYKQVIRADAGSFEAEVLGVAELDDAGRLAVMSSYDLDDFERALAELDERFMAGEGAEFAETIRVGTAVTRAVSQGAMDYLDLVSDDFVQVDHRPASLGEMYGRDAFEASVVAIQELMPGLIVYAQSYVLVRHGGVVLDILTVGRTPDGAEIEQAWYAVATVRDGLLTRVERYAPEDLESALARFKELTGTASSSWPAVASTETVCSRAVGDLVAAFERRDWNAVSNVLHEDAILEDRRRAISARHVGRDASLADLKSIAEIGVAKIDRTLVAARGRSGVLEKWIFSGTGPGGLTAEAMTTFETSPDGKVVSAITYDTDDFDSALKELDARFAAGEGAEFAAEIRIATGFLESVTRRAVNECPLFLTDDFVQIDRRPASLGEMHGRDEFVSSMEVLLELIREIRTYAQAFHGVRSNACLVTVIVSGRTADGAEIEQAYYAIGLIRDGRLNFLERFDMDDFEAALRRFDDLTLATPEDELTSPSPLEWPRENDAARIQRVLADTFVARDWDAYAAVLAEDVVAEDRRPLFANAQHGHREVMEMVVGMADIGTVGAEWKLVATRGGRLAVTRMVFSGKDVGAGAYEVELVYLLETNGEGLLLRMSSFDASELGAVMAELEDRFLRGEGAEHADVWTPTSRFVGAYNAGDWEGLRNVVTDDATLVDHRLASLGEITGGDTLARALSELRGLVPDAVLCVTKVDRVGKDLVLGPVSGVGTTPEGAVVEFVVNAIVQSRDARLIRLELFPIEQHDAAQARFDELGQGKRASNLENACVRVWRQALDAFARRDMDGFAALLRPDVTTESRRQGLRDFREGREAFMEGIRAAADIGVVRFELTPLAIFGERSALGRLEAVGANFEAELLNLAELDEHGRLRSEIHFDPDDLDGAIQEGARRLASTLDAASRPVITSIIRMLGGFNTRDWDAVREELADDIVVVDHRPASLGELRGADAYLDAVRQLTEVVDGLYFYPAALHRADPRGGVGQVAGVGKTLEGTPVEFAFHVVVLQRGGKVVRSEWFPVDRLDDALACFDELASTAPTAIRNQAVDVMVRYFGAFNAEDWTTVASLLAEESVWDDRRQGLRSYFAGRDARVENIQAMRSAGARNFAFQPLAIRGDRLVLGSNTITADEESATEIVHLIVCEIDDEGRIAVTIGFDEEDLAYVELDERYLAGEGAPYSSFRSAFDHVAAYNTRDWEGMRATATDDFVWVDHRPAASGRREGIGALIELYRSLHELIPDARMRVPELHAIDERGIVSPLIVSGTTPEGAEVEIANLSIAIFRDDRISRVDVLPAGEVEAALARFAELAVPVPSDRFENRATEAMRRGFDLTLRGQWAELRALMTPEMELDDRRAGLHSTVVGVEANIASSKAILSVGATDAEIEPLATRGERLVLSSVTIRSAASDFEVHVLEVLEVDDEGRGLRAVMFDADNLDAAFAELDERFATGEGRSNAEIVRLTSRCFAALNVRDWDSFADTVAEDLVLVDHRRVSLGELSGSGAWIDSLRVMRELNPDRRTNIAEFCALSHRGALARVRSVGTTEAGGEIEDGALYVAVVPEGRLARVEIFPVEELAEALVRFEELCGVASPDNAATRTVSRVLAAFERRDWDEVTSLHSESTVEEDRRTGFKTVLRGRAQVIENIRAIAEVGTHRIDHQTVATRCDRLALHRLVFRGRDEAPATFAMEALLLFEVDADARVSLMLMFDSDDVDSAFDELDERFVVGEGARCAEVARLALRNIAAVNRADWEGFRATLADDLIFVDHRLASAESSRGADRRVDEFRTLVGLMSSYRLDVVAIAALEPKHVLGSLEVRGQTADGAAIETGFHLLCTLGDGVFTDLEAFALEDLDDALLRFAEITRHHDIADSQAAFVMERYEQAFGRLGAEQQQRSAAQVARLENAATRAEQKTLDAGLAAQWDVVEAIYSLDSWTEDRRQGLSNRTVGRAASIDMAKAINSASVESVTFVTLAIRGERLALIRETFRGNQESSFEVETLQIIEIDEEERILGNTTFDIDDLDSAFAELDKRYWSGEGTRYPNLRTAADIGDAYFARDWERYARGFAPDFEYVDHRPASLGTLNLTELIAAGKGLLEVVPDLKGRVLNYEAIATYGAVALTSLTGTNSAGGPVELTSYAVHEVRDGLHVRQEEFPLDQRDAALARFEELGRGSDETLRLENDCTRALDRLRTLVESDDWDGVAGILADDAVIDDRRPGLTWREQGREKTLANLRVANEWVIGATLPFATRGDRLALSRNVWQLPNGFEVEILQLTEINGDGLFSHVVIFDPTSLDAAFTELDDRYLAGEGAQYSAMWHLGAVAREAHEARDWARLGSLVSEDVIYVDHRLANLGRVDGRDAFLGAIKALTDVVPDITYRASSMEAIKNDVAIGRTRFTGTNSEGGPIEVELYTVHQVRNGQLVRQEEFALEDRDAALACFERLASATPDLENAASRAVRLSAEATLRADWDAYAALQSPDFRGEDRRSGLRMEGGNEERIENARAILAVGVTHIENECLAVRGEKLALVRATYRDAERTLEVQVIGVVEVDDERRVVFASVLDPDELDAAFAELDERYMASLEEPQVARISAQFVKAFNSRDWDGMRLLMGDFVYVDHQPAGVGTVEGFDLYVRTVSTLLDLVPDLRVAVTEIFAMSDCCLAYRLQEHGTDESGNAIQFEYAGVGVTNGGRITRIENFPIEELDAALARFEELSRGSAPTG